MSFYVVLFVYLFLISFSVELKFILWCGVFVENVVSKWKFFDIMFCLLCGFYQNFCGNSMEKSQLLQCKLEKYQFFNK